MISRILLSVRGLLFCILCDALISGRPVGISAQPRSELPDMINMGRPRGSSELTGTWRGAGITLTLYAQGIATLEQSDVRALINKNNSSTTQDVLRGLWWEPHTAPLRTLCLFFDLTARCLPISISRLKPSSLAVLIGHQTQVILKRASLGHSRALPGSTPAQ